MPVLFMGRFVTGSWWSSWYQLTGGLQERRRRFQHACHIQGLLSEGEL